MFQQLYVPAAELYYSNLINFVLLKIKILFSYFLTLLINLTVVAAMPPITVKPSLTGKRVRGDNSSAMKEHRLFCNHSSGLTIFTYLPATTMNLKLP